MEAGAIIHNPSSLAKKPFLYVLLQLLDVDNIDEIYDRIESKKNVGHRNQGNLPMLKIAINVCITTVWVVQINSMLFTGEVIPNTTDKLISVFNGQ